MTDRGLPIVDGAPACPFVAFDDDRDGRSQAPDHRHRCFAEARPAPRALAHQEAYCLSSAFPVCPTFQDWARREAAATRPAAAAPAPAAAPESTPAPGQPIAARDPASDERAGYDAQPPMPPRRNASRDWAAPPPWAGQEVGEPTDFEEAGPPGSAAAGAAAGSAAAGLAGSAAYRLAGPDPDEPLPARPVEAGPDAYGSYDPAPQRGRTTTPGDDAPGTYEGGDEFEAEAGSYGSYEQRGAGRGGRPAAVGQGSRGAASQARPAPRRYEAEDPSEVFGPAWEHPRRYEAYPTLRTRVGLPSFRGIPRLGLAAIAVLVAALALFFVGPMLLGVGSNDGAGGAATPQPSAEASASIAPTIPPAPTPQAYVVVKGDTLSKIAKRFGVTVQEIQDANPQIKNINKITIGDQIIIPVPKASVVPDASEEVTSAP
jgi:hypothetical protein